MSSLFGNIPTPPSTPPRTATAGNGHAIWDPYKVFNIYPDSADFGCLAIAASTGVRCQWKFWDYSIQGDARKQLDYIATMHPSAIPQSEFLKLARTMCFHINHVDQKDKFAAQFEIMAKEYARREPVRHPLPVRSEAEILLGEMRQKLETIKTETEKVQRESEQLREERDEVRDQCAKFKDEAATLRSQQSQSLARFEQAEKRLKARITESAATAKQQLEDVTKAKDDEIASLTKQLAESQQLISSKSNKITSLKERLQDFQKVDFGNSNEIKRLENELEKAQKVDLVKGDEITSLKNRLEESQQADSAISEEIQRLGKELEEERNVAEEIKVVHSKTITDLTTRLDTTNTQIRALKATNQTLHESESQLKTQLSHSEHQLKKSKRQQHITKFLSHIQISLSEKKHNRLSTQNEELSQQNAELVGRVEDTQGRLAGKDVS